MEVKEVTDGNFQAEMNAHKHIVVKYYADWCGACKLFQPKYKRLAKDERFFGVTFLKINAEQNPEARKAAGVDHLPFFAVFKNGELFKALSTSKEEAVVDLINQLDG